jgi:cytochrome b561
MSLRNTHERYGGIAQLLHWTIVALIIVQYVLANRAEDLPLGPDKISTLATHKSIGITILGLVVLRLVWRLLNPPPPLPVGMKTWEVSLARLTHLLLYGLLFAVPISGWLMSSAANFPVSWFGLIQLPDFVTPSHDLHEQLESLHENLNTAMFALAIAHILAALRHHFLLKDSVLRRMLPWT